MGGVAWGWVLVRHKHPTLVVPEHTVGDVYRDGERDDGDDGGDDGDGGNDGNVFGNDGNAFGEAVGEFRYQVTEAWGRASTLHDKTT